MSSRLPYVPTVIDDATRALAQQLIDEGSSDCDIKETHWRCYLGFCQVNGLDPREDFDDAIAPFAASLMQQGRKAGTVKVYLTHVHELYLESRSNYACVMRALTARIAREGTTHAIDLSDGTVQAILETMFSRIDPMIGLTCCFAWITGLRPHDISEVQRKCVLITDAHLRVEIHISKNRHDIHDRAELRVPLAWLPDVPCNVRQPLLDHFKQGNPEELLFPHSDPGSINRALRRTCDALGIAPRSVGHQYPTSYSFRRSFIQRMERQLTDPITGIVDWNKLTQLTLHQTERCVRAFYVERVSQINSAGSHPSEPVLDMSMLTRL